MIRTLKLVHFRNFSEKILHFDAEKNALIGQNGAGKTNILEAISILGDRHIVPISFDEMVQLGQEYFFVECEYENGETRSISYDKNTKRKKYFLNNKPTIKKKYLESTHICCNFGPLFMNIMYLSPSLRRDFLDQVITTAYPHYSELLKKYKAIVTNRNKTLQSVQQGTSQASEIDFWDQSFVQLAEEIYVYRKELVSFFQAHINEAKEYLGDEADSITLEYLSKVDLNNPQTSLTEYLIKNRQRDIILGKTAIGPHVDDFEILVNSDLALAHFASRGETKSVILWLKMLETVFIEKKTEKKPVLLIDDLLSELDQNHTQLFTEKIKYYQTIFSSIQPIENIKNSITIE
ncbi:DNA replication and repair protein RecF [Candidatus Gracilibacteria bacterium]|nr:DNA replication and repair protein RecF [Candidatus Gracilibacteria bacterium]